MVAAATAETLFKGTDGERWAKGCWISPDGSMVVGHFRSDDNRVVMFDVETGRSIAQLDMAAHEDPPSIAFRPDGLVYAWAPTGEAISQARTPLGVRVGLAQPESFKTRGKGRGLSYSMDGRLLLHSTRDGSSAYRADTGDHLTDWSGTRAVLSDDGTRIAGSVHVGSSIGKLSIHRIARDQATPARGSGALATIVAATEDQVRLNGGTHTGIFVDQTVVYDGSTIGVVTSVTADSAKVRVYTDTPPVPVGGTVVAVTK